MFQFPLGFVRLFSLLDGISFLVLLYFSIYEKRMLGNEEAIRVPGMIHGGIFSVLILLLFVMLAMKDWPIKRAGLVVLCAIIPFAPFWLDGVLKKEQQDAK